MANRCDITGKRPNSAQNVSHAHNTSKRKQYPNLFKKRIYIPELDRTVKVKVSANALRSIDKNGLAATLKKHGKTIQDLL